MMPPMLPRPMTATLVRSGCPMAMMPPVSPQPRDLLAAHHRINGAVETANRDGRPAPISPDIVISWVTMATMVRPSTDEGRGRRDQQGECHAVHGFAENAFRMQRRGEAGAGR